MAAGILLLGSAASAVARGKVPFLRAAMGVVGLALGVSLMLNFRELPRVAGGPMALGVVFGLGVIVVVAGTLVGAANARRLRGLVEEERERTEGRGMGALVVGARIVVLVACVVELLSEGLAPWERLSLGVMAFSVVAWTVFEWCLARRQGRRERGGGGRTG